MGRCRDSRHIRGMGFSYASIDDVSILFEVFQVGASVADVIHLTFVSLSLAQLLLSIDCKQKRSRDARFCVSMFCYDLTGNDRVLLFSSKFQTPPRSAISDALQFSTAKPSGESCSARAHAISLTGQFRSRNLIDL